MGDGVAVCRIFVTFASRESGFIHWEKALCQQLGRPVLYEIGDCRTNFDAVWMMMRSRIIAVSYLNTIPFIYNDLKECTDYPYIYGYINGKVCLLDAKDASMVVPCQYDKIESEVYG